MPSPSKWRKRGEVFRLAWISLSLSISIWKEIGGVKEAIADSRANCIELETQCDSLRHSLEAKRHHLGFLSERLREMSTSKRRVSHFKSIVLFSFIYLAFAFHPAAGAFPQGCCRAVEGAETFALLRVPQERLLQTKARQRREPQES